MNHWIKTWNGVIVDVAKAICIYIQEQEPNISSKYVFVVAEFPVPEKGFGEKIEPAWKSLQKFESLKSAQVYIDALYEELQKSNHLMYDDE